MYNLILTRLTTQRDMQSLIKLLFKIPGINPKRVSEGLKVQPFFIASFEKESQAEEFRTILEKLGAVCEIENTQAIPKEYTKEHAANPSSQPVFSSPSPTHHSAIREEKSTTFNPVTPHKHQSFLKKWRFWILTFTIIGIFFIIDNVDLAEKVKKAMAENKTNKTEHAKEVKKETVKKVNKEVGKDNNELKKSLVKNPYNPEAWKDLSKNLKEGGDTAAARAAEEAYEKAIKTQMIMASLAKAFGSNVRVDISEEAVYYRTSNDFTDSEFYEEAHRLRDSLNTKMPEKDLVVENYTPSNEFQAIRIRPSYSKEKDSPK